MNLVSILAREVTKKGRIDAEMEKQVVSQERYLFEGEDLTTKMISLQHGTREGGHTVVHSSYSILLLCLRYR